jgi:hypothetical protein
MPNKQIFIDREEHCLNLILENRKRKPFAFNPYLFDLPPWHLVPTLPIGNPELNQQFFSVIVNQLNFFNGSFSSSMSLFVAGKQIMKERK